MKGKNMRQKISFKMNILRITIMLIIVANAALRAYSQHADEFAKIGNMPAATRLHLLEEKAPDDLPEVKLPVSNDASARFKPFQLMDTEEELSVNFEFELEEDAILFKLAFG